MPRNRVSQTKQKITPDLLWDSYRFAIVQAQGFAPASTTLAPNAKLHRGVGTSFLLQSGMQIPITWKHDSILSHQPLDLHSSHFWALSPFLQPCVLHVRAKNTAPHG